jgi:hypothetical protein
MQLVGQPIQEVILTWVRQVKNVALIEHDVADEESFQFGRRIFGLPFGFVGGCREACQKQKQ